MLELQPRSPLHGISHQQRTIHDAPGVRIAEQIGGAIISLRCSRADADAVETVARVLGRAPPEIPNRVSADSGMRVAWKEPNVWLVFADAARRDAILHKASLAPRLHATDLSASFCVLAVSGAQAGRLLSTGCPVDLYASAFKSGDCASTLFNEIPVHIQRDEEAYLVACERALAAALWEDFIEAVRYLEPEFD